MLAGIGNRLIESPRADLAHVPQLAQAFASRAAISCPSQETDKQHMLHTASTRESKNLQ